MWVRRWFCFGCGIKEEIIDPRKSNLFIEDVMDPYGRQDKCLKELRKQVEEEERKKEILKNYMENIDKLKL